MQPESRGLTARGPVAVAWVRSSRPRAALIVAAALTLGLSAVPMARAGQSGRFLPPAADDEPQIPNVPDRNGCVKLCDLDELPCDPPLYKKLDGRCNLKN